MTGNGRNDLVVNGDYDHDDYLWMFTQEKNGKLGPRPADFAFSARGTAG